MPMNLVGLKKVRNGDAGWRPAWSTSGSRSAARSAGGRRHRGLKRGASSLRSAAAAAVKAGLRVSGAQAALLQTQIYHHALATGFSRGYLVSAGILALILIIALFTMRVRRQDLSGADRRRLVTPAHRARREAP